MNELAGLRRILVAVARAVVYVAGMAFGFLVASIVSSFGGSFTTDFFGVFFGLGLMLAAPICWVAAIKSSKGDRWTLGYIGGWAVFFLIGYVTSTIEDGQPIKVSDDAVNWGLAALAGFYFLILPAGVILYRRRVKREVADRSRTRTSMTPSAGIGCGGTNTYPTRGQATRGQKNR